jgi:hypothetical protein
VSAIELGVKTNGETRMVFDDRVDLRSVGCISIRRGSQVEPTSVGQWTADLSPVAGPTLGPFDKRSEALAAEVAWLHRNWLIRSTG